MLKMLGKIRHYSRQGRWPIEYLERRGNLLDLEKYVGCDFKEVSQDRRFGVGRTGYSTNTKCICGTVNKSAWLRHCFHFVSL